MVAIFSLLVAILASLLSNFNHESAVREKNDTYENNGLKGLFDSHVGCFEGFGSALVNIIGGGNEGPGGPDDRDDFRPGKWRLLPFVEFKPLMWYDLQWSPPEDISLLPKQWYEDEELVVAWYSIKSKEANSEINCNCQGACNCNTFVREEIDAALHVYLKHPVTREISSLQLQKCYASNELYLLCEVSRVLKMNLQTWMLLIDSQPMSRNCHLEQGSLIELIPRVPGGAKGCKTATTPLKPKRKPNQSASGNTLQKYDESDDEEDRRSLMEEPIRYHVPTFFDSEDDSQAGDEENRLSIAQPNVKISKGKKGILGRIRNENNKRNKCQAKPSTCTRKQKALSDTTIRQIMKEKCCKASCMQLKLTREEIVKSRKAYHDLSEEEDRRSLILTFLHLSHYHENGRRQYTFRVNGKEVCRTAWLRANSVSATTFHRLQREFEHEGRVSPVGARKGRQIIKPSTLKAEAWLKDYVEDSADPLPNEDRYCLPTCMTKKEIYNTYCEEVESTGGKPISLPSFCRMWKRKFRNVIIPKENKFTKCGVCVALKLCLQGTTDKEKRMSFALRRKLHNDQQMAERRAYYRNCLKAEISPKKYLSLIVDGMDQSKTNLPHANCLSKDETYHFLRTHITGAISHGNGRIFTFIDLMRWPHDSNLTLNVLLRIFTEIAEEGQLSPYLFLQMDNCYRECKNRFILGFCALLVERGIFQEVHLSFLMVGHTHEDVDQFFSRISKRSRRVDSMTLPELMANVKQAHKPEAETHILDFIFGIKKWIEPCLNSIKNHIYPHAYKFFKRNDEVVMKYKQWANDEKWLPEGSDHSILARQPEGTPPLVRPDTKKLMEVDALADCIKKCRRLTTEQRKWWEEFLDKEGRYRNKWNAASEDYLSQAKKNRWFLEKLKRHRPTKEIQKQDQDQEEREKQLECLLNKANQFPKVVIGEKRKKTTKADSQRPKKKKTT